MARFRKKPVEVEAVKIEQRMDILSPPWWYEAVSTNTVITHGLGKYGDGPVYVEISTLEGTMRGNEGDWVIRGVKGELYPCKPDIFSATYESADG